MQQSAVMSPENCYSQGHLHLCSDAEGSGGNILCWSARGGVALEADMANDYWRRFYTVLGVCLVVPPWFEGIDDDVLAGKSVPRINRSGG
jgi:hypothetical protein